MICICQWRVKDELRRGLLCSVLSELSQLRHASALLMQLHNAEERISHSGSMLGLTVTGLAFTRIYHVL